MRTGQELIRTIWRWLKVTRRVVLGPVTVLLRFERSIRLTRGTSGYWHFGAIRTQPALPGVAGHDKATHGEPSRLHARRIVECAVIIGAGPGLGYALARLLAREGFDTVLVSRDADRHLPIVADLRAQGLLASCYGADATDEVEVCRLFSCINRAHGAPALVVYAIQNFGPGGAMDIEVSAFEAGWRHNCLGSFLVSREAAKRMLPLAAGTIVLVGSTSAMIGRAGHLNLAVGKFGQRALAQVMARELGPRGIHIAHAVIDADISEESEASMQSAQSNPHDIALAILGLHRQPRTAWTSELDLRPWNESFWEHC